MKCDTSIHPHAAFSINLRWLSARGPTVSSQEKLWRLEARKANLTLTKVPYPQAESPTNDPFCEPIPFPFSSDSHRLHVLYWAIVLAGLRLAYVPDLEGNSYLARLNMFTKDVSFTSNSQLDHHSQTSRGSEDGHLGETEMVRIEDGIIPFGEQYNSTLWNAVMKSRKSKPTLASHSPRFSTSSQLSTQEIFPAHLSLIHDKTACLLRFTSFYVVFIPHINTPDSTKLSGEGNLVLRNLHHVWASYKE